MNELVNELLEEFGELTVTEVAEETGALPECIKAYLRTLDDVVTDDNEVYWLLD